MNLRAQLRVISRLAILLAILLPALPFTSQAADEPNDSQANAIIWQSPGDITTRNLYFAQGSGERAPKGPFKLIKQDTSGSSLKYDVVDAQGVKWRVKLGIEAQAEMVSTHLVWALGYFTDETYFLPMMKVEGLKDVHAEGQGSIRGVLQNARLERDDPNEKVLAWEWNWFENPFVGSKEFDGLRVMMALINNWDLKPSNNKISLDKATGQVRYYINDLGATFGRTGGAGVRSRNDMKDYIYEKFVERVTPDSVDLVMKSRPPMVAAIFRPAYYSQRKNMSKITEDIPREHVRWIGKQLAQLSDEQLRDAFRAAHYDKHEIDLYVQALRSRINELAKL